MNQVVLVGNISTDVECKALEGDKFLSKFNLAVSHGWGDKKKTSFVQIVCFGNTAKAVADFSGKGKKVGIVGRLEINRVEKDGQKRDYTSVVASEVEFLSPKSDAPAESPAPASEDAPW